ncbi:hypothetical protein PTSG_08409 [Salpingoeca rosetta]|uniref:Sulfotransferase domain-containing protein n=1 Tax=Salpingoeca rosetta (strain ATCC 50818 / BSB-021) TaxID=946362 RepID=F2UJL5_SALR5|nr:uncharacterized protein PTSG_08409 [Salpingoeca rosetta]EGD77314.1 hypothetical protein PTSG_08409 [Salpingoeca rosetta]|eukprot:XP_004990658.1 hypothetical protein PTSG_08409 [Salpingoeca rosetta]
MMPVALAMVMVVVAASSIMPAQLVAAGGKRTYDFQRDLTPHNLEKLVCGGSGGGSEWQRGGGVDECPLVPGHTRPPPQLLKHIRWLHAPKTGTSFGTCLIHYACPLLPGSIYPHKFTLEEAQNSSSGASPSELMRFFLERYKTKEYCPGDVHLRKMWGHKTLKETEIKQGGIVGMFRDPRIRDYSEYRVHGHIGTSRHPRNISTYVSMYRGCQTKMLLCKPCNRPKDPEFWFYNTTKQELETAIRLLRSEKISFVGLTDYWRESICLFHAMFGGNITEHEFTNTRPGVSNTAEDIHATMNHPGLEHISAADDPADWEIFKVAKEIFVTRLVQYGIEVPASLKRSMSLNDQPVQRYFPDSNGDSIDDDDAAQGNDDDDAADDDDQA